MKLGYLTIDPAHLRLKDNHHGPRGSTLRHGWLLVRMDAYVPMLGIWRYWADGSARLVTIAWTRTRRERVFANRWQKRVCLPWKRAQ